ncbi:hypothetical protein F8M41_017723 [Gigaspora margarita]|uniref:Uncharacterized protein n=1 Tax=Gigaspora margarita TaxID=4874 RepID=A0A8H4AMP9_GIGMA|nr:hypothetical protein F8M41_017723 [Gigaspora margarita]
MMKSFLWLFASFCIVYFLVVQASPIAIPTVPQKPPIPNVGCDQFKVTCILDTDCDADKICNKTPKGLFCGRNTTSNTPTPGLDKLGCPGTKEQFFTDAFPVNCLTSVDCTREGFTDCTSTATGVFCFCNDPSGFTVIKFIGAFFIQPGLTVLSIFVTNFTLGIKSMGVFVFAIWNL